MPATAPTASFSQRVEQARQAVDALDEIRRLTALPSRNATERRRLKKLWRTVNRFRRANPAPAADVCEDELIADARATLDATAELAEALDRRVM
jgi:hypothetical protein